jgi:hypothetical protein
MSATSFFGGAFFGGEFFNVATVAVSPSGGYHELPAPRRRTKADIRAERAAYGILQAPEGIEAAKAVAVVVAESREKPGLELSERDQVEQIRSLLSQKGLMLRNHQTINALLLQAIAAQAAQAADDDAIVRLLMEM